MINWYQTSKNGDGTGARTRGQIMRKVLNFILLWLVLFLAFQAFACKSVQKGVKEEPGEAAVTKSQTNTMETGTRKAAGNATGKTKTGSSETVKKKAGSNETGKSKQGTLAELKEEVISEVEKIISPSVKKAILPSGVGLLILASLLSSRKERDVYKRKKHL
jgi:hypothetical protein